MAWTDIQSKIDWYPGWTTNPIAHPMRAPTASETNEIEQYLYNLYNSSPSAASAMEEAVFKVGLLRIGIATNGEPGFMGANAAGTYGYIGFSGPDSDRLYYFNENGELTQATRDLTLIHEIIHLTGLSDPISATDGLYETIANGANFDFDGATVVAQNIIAAELGQFDLKQVSYESVLLGSARHSALIAIGPVGHSFTNGAQIDVARLGDWDSSFPNDDIDHTLRTDKVRDLIFAFDGDDTVKSGLGNDFVYGGNGADTIDGGDGNDHLYGGADNDILIGGGGDDEIWGGVKAVPGGTSDGTDKVEYAGSSQAVKINFEGGGTPVVTVEDGTGGTDTLHSIEQIIGTAKRDILTVSGVIPTDTVLTIDAAGGQAPNPHATIDLSGASSDTKLTLDGSGIGYVKSVGGGQINLVGFQTQIVGSSHNDELADGSSGHKRIDGGAGDDEITVTAGSAMLNGGEGIDNLNGGAGNDILAGDAGENKLYGNGGSDRLTSISDYDELYGGDDHDMLVLAADIATAKLAGGHGNDVIDAHGNDPQANFADRFGDVGWTGDIDGIVYYEFNSGDGHDAFLGNTSSIFAPTLGDVYSTNGIPDNELGIDAIRFNDLSINDVTFV